MTPADIKIVWPTSCEIARAVFAACGSQADAIDVLQGHGDSRARIYAFVAVAHQFPTAPRAALGRKVGDERIRAKIRSGWAGTSKWFDIARLNGVRAALGWSPMTEREAIDAPLIYCGRDWTEFLDRGAEQREAPPSSAYDPAAGGRGDETPAPISTLTRGAEIASKPDETPSEAPELLASTAAPKSDESERLAAVERMKAWGQNEPIPEPVPAPVAEVEAQPKPKSAPICQPESPPAPSSRAAALAGAARVMQAAKPQAQRVTPPAQVTAVTRRALNNAPPAATGKPLFAPAPKDTRNEIADTRRPQNELHGRLLNVSLRGVTSFRPDPPAEKRGAVNVTAELMGDPSPGRREELERRRASESKLPRGEYWS